MSAIVRRLVPIYLAEFLLVPISWTLFDAASTSVWSHIPMLISFSVLPFLAGYLAVRASYTLSLRYCAAAGASVSLASIAAATLWFIFQSQPGEYFLSVAGYILSTLFLAIVPLFLFGSLGGWVGRKGHHASSST